MTYSKEDIWKAFLLSPELDAKMLAIVNAIIRRQRMSEHNLDYKNITCPKTQAAMESVRMAFMVAEKEIADNCKESREASLAFTKLEESLMWAIKSLAVHGHELPDSGEQLELKV